MALTLAVAIKVWLARGNLTQRGGPLSKVLHLNGQRGPAGALRGTDPKCPVSERVELDDACQRKLQRSDPDASPKITHNVIAA